MTCPAASGVIRDPCLTDPCSGAGTQRSWTEQQRDTGISAEFSRAGQASPRCQGGRRGWCTKRTPRLGRGAPTSQHREAK